MDKDERLISFVKDAIRIKSCSGREEEAALFFKSKMESLGFDEVVIDKYGSVIGTINGKYDGPTILMDGHIDTVDVVDEDEWTHSPFKAEVDGGRIYGRGTSDMKASLCAMIAATSEFKEKTKGNFKGRVCVSGTVHEECFEGVSSRLVSEYVNPDFVIIGEATSGSVKIGQRGRAEIIVESEGLSCHSSNPEKGNNAVYQMVTIIEEIKRIKPNEHPILGKGILELTDIKSEPYPGASVVPSRCKATFDRRTLVGESEESILSEIEEAIERAKEKNPLINAKAYIAIGEEKCWTGETIKAKRFFPAWCYSEDNEYIKKAISSLKEAKIKCDVSHFSFCTNGSHFCGEKGIVGIGYGPSEEYLAHVRDEYIEISSLLDAKKGFERILHGILN